MTQTMHARGPFEVTLTPAGDKADVIGRMMIEKRFSGELEGASQGQMLSVGTSVKGSAAYVAIERFSGALHGRTGTFVLHHKGTMNRGVPQLSLTVVPDSGTEQLEGIAGAMAIAIVDGKHSYDFEYTLPSADG
jgi:hypothetical protein